MVVADAGEDDFGMPRRLGRRLPGAAVEARQPCLNFRRRSVVHGDLVPTAGNKVARHGESHDTEANERKFHCKSPSRQVFGFVASLRVRGKLSVALSVTARWRDEDV